MPKIQGTSTYTCDECGDTFECGSDEEAEEEALQLFGVENAGSDPRMAIVCDDCFSKLKSRWTGCLLITYRSST